MKEMLFVADDPDSAGDFCLESGLAAGHLPDAFNKLVICQANSGDAGRVRAEMFAAVNAGATLLAFRGHGSIGNWATPTLLANGDVSQFTNVGKPVVIITGDCLDGFFTYPSIQGLGETLLRAPGVGSAAHWSSSGLGLPTEHSILTEDLFRGIFQLGLTALGDATTYAKIAYMAGGGSRALAYTFVLLGDPAMQLMRPALSLAKEGLAAWANPGDQVQFVLTAENQGLYPSPLTITDTLPAGLSFVTAASNLTITTSQAGPDVVFDVAYGAGPEDAGLPWGSAAVITLTAQVDAGTPGGALTNTAVVAGAGSEALPGDEGASAALEINSAPLAKKNSYQTPAGRPLKRQAPGVLGNDTDPDGDPLTAALVQGPGHGTLTFNSDGSFRYLPTPGYTGRDLFIYQALDGRGGTTTAVVVIRVLAP
jgi:uncharacterized repeat protein (TIGR01451 family)